MAVNLSPVGGVAAQFFDNAGNVLTGGKLYTYAAGTTTPQTAYTTSAGNVPWSNPIILDAAGRVSGSGEIWLSDGVQYKFILRDSNDVLIATYDNIIGINSNFVNFTNEQEIQTATAGQTVFNLTTMQYSPGTNSLSVFVDGVNQYGPGAQYAYLETDSDTVTFVNGLHVGALVKFTTSQLNSSSGVDAEQVSYIPPFVNSVSTNVEAKLAQTVSVKDFGAVGDGVTNDTTAILNAIDSDRDVYFPAGTYLITAPCVFSNKTNIRIKGAGRDSTIIKCNAASTFTNSAIAFVNSSYIEMTDVTIDQNNNASFTATWPLVIFLTSTFVTVANSNFVNVTYIGLALNQVQDFWIVNNFLEHNTAINSTNYNINVSSTTGNPSRRGMIKNNVMLRSSNIFSGRDHVIDGNISLSCKYGAGIVTQGDAGFVYGGYVVSNNICNSGTGVDTDGVDVAGMEIGGISVVVSNNTCNQNGGAGIANLARNAIISNNVCLGNGQNSTATDVYRSGILMGFVDATYGAHFCHVVGNRCGDDGSGRQKYGYYEQGSAINNTALMANNFVGNITAETFIQSTNGFYETNVWTAWTPTVTSTTGTITTLGAVTAKYRLESKTVFFIVSATITTNGTGAGSVKITLPPILGGSANGNQSCSGREYGVTGKTLVGAILNGTQGINVQFYDGTYPGANGHVIQIQGFYEVT